MSGKKYSCQGVDQRPFFISMLNIIYQCCLNIQMTSY